jgi:hypothetical protein
LHSTSIVWFAFPISEIAIFILSFMFLRGIYGKYLGNKSVLPSSLLLRNSPDIM